MADNTEQLTFDYVDLNQIDPSFSTLPEDIYTLRILKMERLTYPKKVNGVPTGEDGQRIAVNLAVADHPSLSGRRIFESLWPSNFTFRVLRRLADNTGVQQEAGAPIETWLQAVSEVQPLIKLKVGFRTKRVQNGDGQWTSEVILNDAGKPQDNAIDWREMQPVS